MSSQTAWTNVLLSLFAFVLTMPVNADPAYPLKTVPGIRYLVDQNEAPFLINGDTPWDLIPGLSKSDAIAYLDDRRARGFNALLVELIEHEFNGPINQEGEYPFLVPGDFGTPNEAYFAHADWVVNQAALRNIVLFITPTYMGYGCGSQGWCREMLDNGPNKMREFGRWLGRRYKEFPNIVWVAGGDVDANQTSGAMAAMEAVVEGILAEDGRHIFTAHCDRYNAAIDCYNRPWLKLNSTYADCNRAAAESKIDYERPSAMPFYFIEGVYESRGSGESCARSQAYTSVLSGSTGHFYGNDPVWMFDPGWQNALNDPGGASLTHFRRLFESRPWWTMTPDFAHRILVSGYGSLSDVSYAPSALTNDRRTFVAYTPYSRTLTVNLTEIAGSESRVWWFNPRTGAATLAGTVTDSTAATYTPPGSGDWVLVIDDASAGLPAPGTPVTSSPLPRPPTSLQVM